MSDYRRWYLPGATYFFTLITCNRQPLFWNSAGREVLGRVMREVCQEQPFSTRAIVLLPDHLHTIWTLPTGDCDYSTRWRKIKGRFASRWVDVGGLEVLPSLSRIAKGERGVWQRRFWERSVRDEVELERLCDYIHFNPVKHGHAGRPQDWPWSSFHRFVRSGDYSADWGRQLPDDHYGDVGE